MRIEKNIILNRTDKKPLLIDTFYSESKTDQPIVVFCHGYKGFKDWGPFNLVANQFAKAGFVFIKMNFSHNGVTLENPNEFADLEAFAKNNFCMELDDTGVLINYLFSSSCTIPKSEIDLNNLYIMGHSRGGAAAILKANHNKMKSKAILFFPCSGSSKLINIFSWSWKILAE